MRKLLTIPALLFCSVALCAQEPNIGSEELQKKIDQRIKAMRDAIRDNKPITTNVRVSVNLRNQYRIDGVVKNGRFIERVDGLHFIAADVKTPGAGIRIWYYNDTNSYMWLPFEAIKSYKIGARLTEVQIQEIEKRIAKAKKDADDQRKMIAAERKKKAEQDVADSEGRSGQTDSAEEKARKALENRLLALVEEFPPNEGWGEERLLEIEKNRIVLGVFPDARSKRFIEVFDDWKRGVKLSGEEVTAEPPTPSPTPSPRPSPRPNKY